MSPPNARWSRSSEPISCSAMTVFFWGTASTSLWCQRNVPYLMDCLWSLLMGMAKQRARREIRPVLWHRTSRDPRRLLPHPQRTPNHPSRRSCQPKTSYTDWTCKSNSQSRLHAGWKKRKSGEALHNPQPNCCFWSVCAGVSYPFTVLPTKLGTLITSNCLLSTNQMAFNLSLMADRCLIQMMGTC